MYVLGYSENFTGEEAKRIIREAVEEFGLSLHEAEALELGTVGGGRFDIDSESLLFVPSDGFHSIDHAGGSAGLFYRKCDHCGIWFNQSDFAHVRATDGVFFCSENCATDSDYRKCNWCGDWVRIDNGLELEDCFYCGDTCAERDDWFCCECCDEWHSLDDSYYINDYGRICDRCYEWGEYYCCENCGNYFHVDDTTYDEDIDDRVCDRCYNANGGGFIHSYGYSPAIEFFGSTDGNTKPYLGIELETDGGSDRRKYAKDLAALGYADRFWMTHDSSLDNGIEVTSHPMTLDEHIKCGLWEDVAKTAIENGFGSHNGGRCGLHIHINRNFFGKSRKAQEVGGYKMMRLMQRFEQQFITFSRRTSTRWCNFTTNYEYGLKPVKVDIKTGSDPYDYKTAGVIGKAERMNNSERTHSQAVNFEHRNTFEIRIFRGTLKIPTLYASFALANGLARACKSHGEAWVERVDWYGLMEWIIADCDNETARTHLKNYLAAKELYVPADFILANHTITEEN